ncbi:fumarylacetoacetate hydrolase [Fusarium beomiforme]|uniref:Fumarylacetoacetate hydrolase n=1 Tax=Fusarium beomiforme TaxID=44412 RepID=A0A9P5DNN0_9HYPO|nr:fumarylacetoacetate hydrolase [Fusarium beomiforme]
MSLPSFTRLIRFIAKNEPDKIFIGEPVSSSEDVGLAVRNGNDVFAYLFTGSSMLAPGEKKEQKVQIDRLLSPLAQEEVGTIRCIGLNYKQHAREVKLAIPTVPTVFLKPATSLNDPFPSPIPLPKLSQSTDSADYEAELAVVIGRSCRNVTEAEAYDYVLGYTVCNDVSSRAPQFRDSQWCFSKGFDGACPLGPTLVSREAIPDPSMLQLRGMRNGQVVQNCGIDDLIFNVPQIVSYLSQDTTLPAGTVILTGTPAGVGYGRSPRQTLKDGDEFSVEILPLIGTLTNMVRNS